MKKIIFILTAVLCSHTVFAQMGTVRITGTVTNLTHAAVDVTLLDYQPVQSAQLAESGSFEMSLNIPYSGYYLLTYGRSTAYVYLHDRDNLQVTFDAANFMETLTFEGKGANRNNYLVAKARSNEQLTKDLAAFYDVDEAAYLKNLEKVKSQNMASLERYQLANFFLDAEKKSLEYERLYSIRSFKRSSKYYLGNEIEPSEEFLAPLNSLNVKLEADYKSQPFYRYLLNDIWEKKIEETEDADGILGLLKTVPFWDLGINVITTIYTKIGSDKERAKDYLDVIKAIITHPPAIEEAEKLYAEVMASSKLEKGADSPAFNYESLEGEMVSLESLKGKYVYIDVWATWCAPCIKQVPYLKALEKQFHDKDIVFVSISLDKPASKATWKKVIAKKELGGVQLFADKSFDSDWMTAYQVNSIPRFILLDPEGKIVDANVPNPSNEQTKVLLEGLLK